MPEDQIERLRALLAHAHDNETPSGARLVLHRLAERLAAPKKKVIVERLQQAQPPKTKKPA